MTKPIKKAGFSQGLLAISADKKEEMGTLRITQDGRKFRYAKAGAAALGAGKCGIAAAVAAGVLNEACASAHAIGDRVIQETITAGGTYATDHFAGGFFQVNDATGEGHQYMIESSSAVGAADTTVYLTLADPIRVALVATTSEFTLVASPWMGVTESATEENMPVGIAPVPVTAAYYYWAQTGGVALCLMDGAAAIGTKMVLGSVAGSLKAVPTPLDIDINFPVGVCFGSAGVDTEYQPVFLTID
jgi:hypothetical protein